MKPADRSQTNTLLASVQRMIAILGEPQLDLGRKLRRLTSLVVEDFPRALFKLQIIASDSTLRVVPEFVTPMLQRIVDRYRATLGPLDIRDARLPAGTDSLVDAGVLSHEELRLTDPADIARYFASHFEHADHERLGETALHDLGVREVLLLPVRPDELPFGVVSVSSQSPFGDDALSYWRTVATIVTEFFRQSEHRLISELRRLALAGVDTPTILLDASGRAIDVNRAAIAVLGFDERETTMRHLGDMRPCLPSRDALAGCPDSDRLENAFYVADAFGAEIACRVETQVLSDGAANVLGAVVRLLPNESRAEQSVRLTRRQREVARLITEGLSSKEVAAELGLSVHTVNYHRAQIRSQLPEDEGDLGTTLRRYFLGRQ